MKCCGNEVTTPFCPMCGKPQSGEGPLYDLLAHIRKELSKHRGRQERIRQGIGQTPYEGETEKLSRWIAKWEAWRDAIVGIIEAKEASPKIKRGD